MAPWKVVVLAQIDENIAHDQIHCLHVFLPAIAHDEVLSLFNNHVRLIEMVIPFVDEVEQPTWTVELEPG